MTSTRCSSEAASSCARSSPRSGWSRGRRQPMAMARATARTVMQAPAEAGPSVAARTVRMLRTAMGPVIARLLDDPDVAEVMLNPDGRLWVDRLGAGIADTGHRLSPADGERIIQLVAHHV